MTSEHPIFDLQRRCYECCECVLGRRAVDGADPHVFGSGNVNAEIMFVGEAPGADEVRMKRPLVGRSGQFYESRILEPAGLRRSEVYTTNAVLCRPNEKNRTPFPTEMELCAPHLDAQILLVKPRLIVTLGNAPLFAVCGTTGITKKRGRLRWSKAWSDGEAIPVLPMFHPAYCLRGSGLKEMEEDVATLRKLSGMARAKGALAEIQAAEDLRTLCDLEAAAEAH